MKYLGSISDNKDLVNKGYVDNLIAPAYSSSSAYSIGQGVIYNNKLYKCNTAIPSPGETWTSAHWTEVKMANTMDDVSDLKSALSVQSTNLFTGSFVAHSTINANTGEYSYNADGNPNTAGNPEYIAVNPDTVYNYSDDSGPLKNTGRIVTIIEYDSSKNWIKKNEGVTVLKTSSSTAYVRLKLSLTGKTEELATTVAQFEKGALPSAYMPPAIMPRPWNVKPEDTSFMETSKNIFRASLVAFSNINNLTGVYSVESGNVNTCCAPEYIAVNAGQIYTFSDNAKTQKVVYIYEYGETLNFIRFYATTYSDGAYQFTVGDSASYIRVKLYKANATEELAVVSAVQLEIGSSRTTYLPPFVTKYDTSNPEYVRSTKNILFGRFVSGSNLNNNNGDWIATGAMNTAAEEAYIPVEPGAAYTYSDLSEDARTVYIFEYKSDKSFNGYTEAKTLTVKADTYYVRIKLYLIGSTDELAATPQPQLEAGSSATEYEPPFINLYDKTYRGYTISGKRLAQGSVPNDALVEGYKRALMRDVIDSKRNGIVNKNSVKKFINFGFCTDTHISENNMSGMIDIMVLNQIGGENWLDFIAHGGDIFNAYAEGSSGNGITHGQAVARIDDALSGFSACKMPVYITKGNHDVNDKYNPTYPDGEIDSTQEITESEFYLLCQSRFAQKVTARFRNSFFVDFDIEKVRVIMLDTFAVTDATSGTEVFLAEALTLGAKADYSVVICTHAQEGLSRYHSKALINAFKSGGTYSDDNVTVDFAEQGNGSFVGVICGHVHHDAESATDGYWVIENSTSYLHDTGTLSTSIYASVFTIDTENTVLYKTCLGDSGTTKGYDWSTLDTV